MSCSSVVDDETSSTVETPLSCKANVISLMYANKGLPLRDSSRNILNSDADDRVKVYTLSALHKDSDPMNMSDEIRQTLQFLNEPAFTSEHKLNEIGLMYGTT